MFRPTDEVPPLKKSMSVYMSNLLKTQDSLEKAAAKELLRTDLLHMTHKKTIITYGLPTRNVCIGTLPYRSPACTSSYVLAWSYESYFRIKFKIYPL